VGELTAVGKGGDVGKAKLLISRRGMEQTRCRGVSVRYGMSYIAEGLYAMLHNNKCKLCSFALRRRHSLDFGRSMSRRLSNGKPFLFPAVGCLVDSHFFPTNHPCYMYQGLKRTRVD
jgi:hypothetical protein